MRATNPRGRRHLALQMRQCERAAPGRSICLLYVSTGVRIVTVVVPTLMQRLEERFAPVLRLRSLVQQERAQMIPATVGSTNGNDHETRAREALRRLMMCRVDVAAVARVLMFACG